MILLPCPFCGCATVSVVRSQYAGYAVMCHNNHCNAEGPDRNTQGTAATAWNARQALPIVPAVDQIPAVADTIPPISPQTGQD
jgi:Lar family restriction alleviation protein